MTLSFKKTLINSAVLLALTGTTTVHAAEGDAVGDVFQVNTLTSGDQTLMWTWGDVAMDADGDFVATWTDYSWEHDGVYMRRFSADGTAKDSSERLVNTTDSGSDHTQSVAMNPDGRFVVVIKDSSDAIWARIYDADGNALGDQLEVSLTGGTNIGASVAMAPDGSFVVVWRKSNPKEVYARRFSADGTALDADEVRVNTTESTFTPSMPHIAMEPAGNYIIVWGGHDGGTDFNVRARRYSADGTAIDANDFIVNTTTDGSQYLTDVGVDASGNVVVAWLDQTSGGSTGVYAKCYDADGNVVKDEFGVILDADYTNSSFGPPYVAMDAEGDFVIATMDYGTSDGDGYATYMQRYDSSCTAQYADPVNVGGPTGSDGAGGVAMDADGDTVVVFTNKDGDDGDGYGVFAQRYEGKGHTVDLMLAGSDDASADIAPGDALTYTFSVINGGSGVALGLSLEDVLPTGISYTGFSDILGDGWSCSDSSGTVTCTLPSLASGGSSSVDITVDTASVKSHSIENSASISNGVTDANDTDNSDTVVTATTYNNLPVFDASPSISGNGVVGETLMVIDTAASDADGDTLTLSYQWQADGVAISGATSSSYTVQPGDEGTAITADVTVSDGYGGTASVTTEAVSIAVDSGSVSSSSGGGGALGWWSLFMGLLLFRRRA